MVTDRGFFAVVADGILSKTSRPLGENVGDTAVLPSRELDGLTPEKAREYLEQRSRFEREQLQATQSFAFDRR